VLGQLELRSERGRTSFAVTDRRMEKSNDEHRGIVAAIRAKDLAETRRCLREHREGVRRALVALNERSVRNEGE
jgi:DNA-binding GntR family transcriptional regulator